MQNAARLLLRLIATGLIIVGGMLAALEFLMHRAKQTELNPLKLALFGGVFLAGALLFAVSRKLAASLTDDAADDDDDPAAPGE